jgi:hypothetical protein
MKDKILDDVKKWYETQNENPDITDFIDIVINKATDSIFDTVKKELENEFSIGNLEHPFIISNEYYLELKLKEIKDKYLKTMKIKDTLKEKDETF